jgi:hypothetical protein
VGRLALLSSGHLGHLLLQFLQRLLLELSLFEVASLFGGL